MSLFRQNRYRPVIFYRYDTVITMKGDTPMEKMTPLDKMLLKKLRRSTRSRWMVD